MNFLFFNFPFVVLILKTELSGDDIDGLKDVMVHKFSFNSNKVTITSKERDYISGNCLTISNLRRRARFCRRSESSNISLSLRFNFIHF